MDWSFNKLIQNSNIESSIKSCIEYNIKSKDKIHIIAEIGVNHNGSLTLAKKMMLASKKCGANSVKFQTYSTDDIIVSNTKKANYQIKNTKNNESQYDMLKKYELDNKNYLLFGEEHFFIDKTSINLEIE